MSVGGLKAKERDKKKKSGFLLDDEWMMSDEQRVWYMWGVEQGIIISPIPVRHVRIGDPPNKWHVGISEPGKHKKIYKSKHHYDWKQIWDEVMNAYKYYYDKQKKV